jgi:hypothetical protein
MFSNYQICFQTIKYVFKLSNMFSNYQICFQTIKYVFQTRWCLENSPPEKDHSYESTTVHIKPPTPKTTTTYSTPHTVTTPETTPSMYPKPSYIPPPPPQGHPAALKLTQNHGNGNENFFPSPQDNVDVLVASIILDV